MFFKSVFVLISFCFLLQSVSCNPIQKNDEIESIIKGLNDEDRSHFIAMHLAFGLLKLRTVAFGSRLMIKLPEDIHVPMENYNKLKAINVPEDFSTDLYLWTKFTYHLNDYEAYEFMTVGQLCFPIYGCFDLGDVGSFCCPF